MRSSCYRKVYHRYTCCLETVNILMCALCFWSFWNCSKFWASSKNRNPIGTQDLRKNGLLEKTGPQGLQMLPFFSSNIKYNVKVIHFHVKRRGVKGHVLVPITFENCILNFFFENGKFGIKKTNANLQPLLAWNVYVCLRTFMQPRFE